MKNSIINNNRLVKRLSVFLLLIIVPACGKKAPVEAIRSLTATGHDSRIDLQWQPAEDEHLAGYNIYRSPEGNGSFIKLNQDPHPTHIYSDFFGENDKTFHYRVSKVFENGKEYSTLSPSVSANSRAMTDDELLTSVQEATFRYFWDYAHPVSGLIRERNHRKDRCTIGGTGFGIVAIMIGADRGFVTRAAAAERLLTILTFLEEKAERFHGVWSHWLDGITGEAVPFAKSGDIRADDGADIVETSFLIQGMLTVRQYFDRDDPVENEIRRRITGLWHQVEWDWFLRYPDGKRLYWHWSPNYGWMMDHAIGGHFNECMITYLLAIASPTHPIPPECYREGWIGDPEEYANGNEYYGYKQWVGWPKGGRLFFTHYSFIGFDPRGKNDGLCNYFDNSRNISLIHRAYSIENPNGFKGYGPLVWGLTSCDTPDGYRGLDPSTLDNGTIAPTAAISAMPYTPEESIATLKHYYHEYGDRLWGPFGFHDSFNLDRDWFAKSYLAIDQGPIICMIENYRTALCWRMFMSNPEIEPMLKAIGWEIDDPAK